MSYPKRSANVTPSQPNVHTISSIMATHTYKITHHKCCQFTHNRPTKKRYQLYTLAYYTYSFQKFYI